MFKGRRVKVLGTFVGTYTEYEGWFLLMTMDAGPDRWDRRLAVYAGPAEFLYRLAITDVDQESGGAFLEAPDIGDLFVSRNAAKLEWCRFPPPVLPHADWAVDEDPGLSASVVPPAGWSAPAPLRVIDPPSVVSVTMGGVTSVADPD